MFEVKTVWAALNVQFALKQPILEWQNVPSRFFKLIHEALSGTLPVLSKEFFLVPANQLSEVRAKYAIYGGASSVSLSADALHFDFPGLLASDQPIVQNILSRIHDAFPKEFREVSYEKIAVKLYRHLEFVNAEESPTVYLSQFALPRSTAELKSVVVIPGAKFELTSEDQTWICSIGAERSIPNARAVFIALDVILNRVDPLSPYQEKLQKMTTIVDVCEKLLMLQVTDAAR